MGIRSYPPPSPHPTQHTHTHTRVAQTCFAQTLSHWQRLLILELDRRQAITRLQLPRRLTKKVCWQTLAVTGSISLFTAMIEFEIVQLMLRVCPQSPQPRITINLGRRTKRQILCPKSMNQQINYRDVAFSNNKYSLRSRHAVRSM